MASATEHKPCVLVVDDSRLVRHTINRMLDAEFDVREAGDGLAGWRQITQNSTIEAIISDIQMPEMDGYSLICKIRAAEDPGLRELPIIVITSTDDDTTRERAYACGANDFILKPFNADQLLNCVRTQVGEHQNAAKQLVSAKAASKPAVAKPGAQDIVVPDTNFGTIESAMEHMDTGLNILRSLQTAVIAPHALSLVLRFMPLLKYCNTKYALGMDKEIAAFQQKIAGTRERVLQSKVKKLNS